MTTAPAPGSGDITMVSRSDVERHRSKGSPLALVGGRDDPSLPVLTRAAYRRTHELITPAIDAPRRFVSLWSTLELLCQQGRLHRYAKLWKGACN
ncbi:MAG: hypothetical protein IT445_00090 [Phycisphaeraceae bacterium]|nr:hypothetical protein [Phycisphaeraceae bacterium]